MIAPLLRIALVLSLLCATAWGEDKTFARDGSPVPLSALTDTLLGPCQRSEVIVEGPIPPDVKDAFHFVLLQGDPPRGRYDWFKIARKPGGESSYLVLGSNDGTLEWVEHGSLLRQENDDSWTLEIPRVVEAEGEKLKIVRRISWRKGDARLTVVIVKQHRYFLNPVWSRPSIEQYLIKPLNGNRNHPAKPTGGRPEPR